jgi:hypothetical protein
MVLAHFEKYSRITSSPVIGDKPPMNIFVVFTGGAMAAAESLRGLTTHTSIFWPGFGVV